jgi:hypothetical protein
VFYLDFLVLFHLNNNISTFRRTLPEVSEYKMLSSDPKSIRRLGPGFKDTVTNLVFFSFRGHFAFSPYFPYA